MDLTDAALIERTLKGDEQAFAELVRRYQAVVWGTVHRMLGNSSEKEDANRQRGRDSQGERSIGSPKPSPKSGRDSRQPSPSPKRERSQGN